VASVAARRPTTIVRRDLCVVDTLMPEGRRPAGICSQSRQFTCLDPRAGGSSALIHIPSAIETGRAGAGRVALARSMVLITS
jgi:hypothetical protein